MAADTFRRITCSSVTDALMQALENAEGTRHVLVLCDGAGEQMDTFYCSAELSVERALWLSERFKQFLLAMADK